MSASVTPIRPPLRPIDRVKMQPTITTQLLAASVEITGLTNMVDVLASALETAARTCDPSMRENMASIVAQARGSIT